MPVSEWRGTELGLAGGRTGGRGRHVGWHASAQGAAGPAAGHAGRGQRGGVQRPFAFPIRSVALSRTRL